MSERVVQGEKQTRNSKERCDHVFLFSSDCTRVSLREQRPRKRASVSTAKLSTNFIIGRKKREEIGGDGDGGENEERRRRWRQT